MANKNFTVKNGLEVGGQEVISSSGVVTSAALGGQVLGTSSSPSFANITTAGYLRGPASFVIDPAAHGNDTGTVVIAGNLQVDGTQTTINSTTMIVDDLNITLASGATNAAAANGSGITIDGASANITYQSNTDTWDFNKNVKFNRVQAHGSNNFTIDSPAEIHLDSHSGFTRLRSQGGDIALLQLSNNDLTIRSMVSDRDIIFQGYDGSTNITALSLDMSNAGRAFFNVGASFSGDVAMADNNKTKYGQGEDLILYSDGTNGEIEAPNGSLTLDVAGDIILDADGGDILLKDGGTHWASVYTNGTNTYIQNMVNSGDVYLSGKDGSGNGVNALILDMSAAGAATFNSSVTAGTNFTFANNNTNNTNKEGHLLARQYASGTETEGFQVLQYFSNSSLNRIDIGGAASTYNAATAINFYTAANTTTRTGTQALTLDSSQNATFSGSVTSTGLTVGNSNIGSNTSHLANLTINNNGYIGSVNATQALQIATSGAATFQSSVIAQTLTSANGLLYLDDNGSHNGIINAPATLFINIDSDNNSTGEDFIIAKDRTGTSGGTELFRISSDGNVGIGTASPSSFVESSRFVVGSGTSGTNEMMFLYSGTDTFGAIGFADGTSGTARYKGIIGYHHDGDEMFFSTNGGGEADRDVTITSAGNVGIGISSPAAKLEVRSDGSASNGAEIRLQHSNNNTNDVVSTVNFANNAGSVGMIQAGTTGANNSGYIDFFTDNAGTSARVARMTPDGNVGIGTSSPGKKLNVKHTGGTGVRIETDGDTDSNFLHFKTSSSTGQGYIGTEGSTAGANFTGTTAYAFVAGSTSSGVDTQFLSAGAVRATIDHTGNVGIGTSAPLSLDGNAAPGLTIKSNGPYILLQDANNSDKVRYISNNTGEFQFGIVGDNGISGKTEHMRIDASGNLLVGKTVENTTTVGIQARADGLFSAVKASAESAIFGRNTNDGNIVLLRKDGSTIGSLGSNTSAGQPVFDISSNSSSGIIRMLTSGTERFRITAAGNVGIGTVVAPANKLNIQVGTDTRVGFWGSSYGAMQVTNDANSVLKPMRFDASEYQFVGGDVVIGTTTNSYLKGKLTVHTTPGVPATSGTSTANVGFRLGTTTGNSQVMDMGVYNASPYGAWIQVSGAGNMASTTPLVLNPNGGNVGIGTDNPTTKLQVNGASDSRVLIYETGTSPYTATLELSSQVIGTYGAIVQYTSAAETLTIQNYGRAVSAGSSTGSIAFKTKVSNTTPTDVMFIHGFTGNVGIGTTSPKSPLDFGVTSTNQQVLLLRQNGNSRTGFSISNNYGVRAFGPADASSTGSLFGVGEMTSGTNYLGDLFTVRYDGNVGIGTTAPDAKLDIRSSGTSTYPLLIKSSDNQQLFRFREESDSRGTFHINDASENSKVTLASSGSSSFMGGKVGIGTTNPYSQLDIQGMAADVYTPTYFNNVPAITIKHGNTNGYYGGIRFTNTVGNYEKFIGSTQTSSDTADIVFQGYDRAATAYKEYVRIKEDGAMSYGGDTGVYEKYFSGSSNGNATFSHDIVHTSDAGVGIVLHVQAAFTHHPSYDCILDTWVSRRQSTVVKSDQFRRDTAVSGGFQVAYVSNTITRITKTAGTYVGGGPYWIKVTWRNA